MDFELPDAKTAQEQSKAQEERLNKIVIERMGYFILKINNQIKQAIDSGKFNCMVSITETTINKVLSQESKRECVMLNRFAKPLDMVNIGLKKYYTDKGYTFSTSIRNELDGTFIDIRIGWR